MELKSGQSEVAQILQQIETEYIAAQHGLTGIAGSARHAAITARMEHMGLLHKDLCAIVGDDAIRLIAERLEAIPDERKADVLCELWEPLRQRESSGPGLPALQAGKSEEAQGRGAAAFYPLLLSLWEALSTT